MTDTVNSLPEKPPQPVVTILSQGAENRLSGSWPDRQFGTVSRAELHSFPVEQPLARAIVYGGGGYTKLVYDKEGMEVALWLAANRIEPHILVHRLPGQDNGMGGVYPKDIALADGLSALDQLGSAGPALPLFHVGLSSGGHLAGVMSCQDHALGASGTIITYAPLNANHRDYKFPPGKSDYPPVEKQAFYDDWPIGIYGQPHGWPKTPVFLAYALNDTSVPLQHALNFLATAAQAGLPVDAHVFGEAPHGFALRSLEGSQAAWPALALDWMKRKI
ncbi:prolyl oligopeptidase family serine peptidase [Martelella sp. HB161492]|uniref:prolyl oligopeptidase family serine peptidase n=1 Tax=Martelella sp. HB161492 TaxID=2720726 RepID=UPI0015907409|nr:prolyl oligopeptidase family serine peptidase [Martelella sp. HB161492]